MIHRNDLDTDGHIVCPDPDPAWGIISDGEIAPSTNLYRAIHIVLVSRAHTRPTPTRALTYLSPMAKLLAHTCIHKNPHLHTHALSHTQKPDLSSRPHPLRQPWILRTRSLAKRSKQLAVPWPSRNGRPRGRQDYRSCERTNIGPDALFGFLQ